MHISPDFKTKKAAKEALAAGRSIYAFQPGGIFPTVYPSVGETRTIVIEAPADYHKWYATARMDSDGKVTSLK